MHDIWSKEKIFSIITVVLNDKSGLEETAKSIRSQDIGDFEWIVVDGGSSDGTIEYLKEVNFCDLRFLSESDNGLYDAMNKGVDLSCCEYIVFLNAGDTFAKKSALRKVFEKISTQSFRPALVFGGANYILSDKKHLYRSPKKVEEYLWHGLPANHQSTFYNRRVIPKPAYDISYKICGDYYLTSKAVQSDNRVAYIDEAIVNFYIGGLSFQNPLFLVKEAYLVQKHILKTSAYLRIVSSVRRIIATLVLRILYIASNISKK